MPVVFNLMNSRKREGGEKERGGRDRQREIKRERDKEREGGERDKKRERGGGREREEEEVNSYQVCQLFITSSY